MKAEKVGGGLDGMRELEGSGRGSDALKPLLLQAGLLDEAELARTLAEARRRRVSLWDVIIDEKHVSESALAETFAQWLGVPRVCLADSPPQPVALRSVGEEMLRRHQCVPLRIDGRFLVLAMANPSDYAAIQEIEFQTGQTVRAVVAERGAILDLLERTFGGTKRLRDVLEHVEDPEEMELLSAEAGVDLDGMDSREAAQLAPVVRMCNLIIQDAIKAQASDVHVEPGARQVQVRLRIDGILRDYMQIPKWLHGALASRLKILADLDIAERRLPQDGRIKAQFRGRPLDLRVSTLPTHFGEKVVMRLLGSNQIPTFRAMGLGDDQANILEHALHQPQGMILVTGPTGSGKTTALYSMLTKRKSPEVNIVTVEDPIEYQLAGVSQVQINPKAGLTFPQCLRSILRQDPDVILVGEIRDLETAEIAFRAAMTGHLVLSTVHTNSAIATIARLLDLGIDPVLITSSIHLIVAQRLARRICMRCREEYVPSPDVLEKLRIDDPMARFHRGRGCGSCAETGFSGRIGIYEMMRMTPRLKDAIHRRAPESELRSVAASTGTRFLALDAMDKLRVGFTSPDEVLRTVQFDDEDQVRCPACTAFVHLDFATCPYCLHSLKSRCGSCTQELKPEWRVCPYCNTPNMAHGGPRAALPDRTSAPPHEMFRATPAPTASPASPVPPQRSGFSLRDEVLDLSAQTSARRAPASSTVPSGKPKVLVIDDEDDIVRAIGLSMRKLPIDVDVLTAGDAREAFALIEQNRPDLVILDVVLPGMDGLEVCRRLRDDPRTSSVPVLMLTARSDDKQRTQGYLVGTDDYMQKPFDLDEFRARVLRLMRRAHGL